MRNISISTFINFIFFIAFIAISAGSLLFVSLDKESFEIDRQKRHEIIANNFLSIFQKFPTYEQLNSLYSKFNTKPVINREIKLHIINNAEELELHRTYLGIYRVLEYEEKIFIYVQQYGYNIMLQDLKAKTYNYLKVFIAFLAAVFIIFFLFFILKKKLMPLKKLNDQINEFSKGNLSIDTSSKNGDEIGEIANNFNNSRIYISKLLSSKNLFMRNMMHELKTPITKAMFAIEVLEESKSKQILNRAFLRMNEIIKELATVEKLTSKVQTLDIQNTCFLKIYDTSLKILMLENNSIDSKIKDFKFDVDINLLSIALKNLLDNAIKFSSEKRAVLLANKDSIEVCSKGSKLKHELDYYTEAFSQEEKRSDGFGLGLYIVKTICDLHGFSFVYKYEKGNNIFCIVLKKSIKKRKKKTLLLKV